MFRHILLIIAFGVMMSVHHTQAQVCDSIRDALTYKPSFVFGLNSRISTISGDPSRTMRLFVGLDYRKKMRFEFAINGMPQAATDMRINEGGDTVRRSNRLTYWGLQAEYTFFRKGHWKLSYPIQVGLGVNNATIRYNQEEVVKRSELVVPLEVGADAIYYFYDWIGLKGGMGVRMSFGNSFSTLSGPYYNLGVALYAGELIRIIKEKQG